MNNYHYEVKKGTELISRVGKRKARVVKELPDGMRFQLELGQGNTKIFHVRQIIKQFMPACEEKEKLEEQLCSRCKKNPVCLNGKCVECLNEAIGKKKPKVETSKREGPKMAQPKKVETEYDLKTAMQLNILDLDIDYIAKALDPDMIPDTTTARAMVKQTLINSKLRFRIVPGEGLQKSSYYLLAEIINEDKPETWNDFKLAASRRFKDTPSYAKAPGHLLKLANLPWNIKVSSGYGKRKVIGAHPQKPDKKSVASISLTQLDAKERALEEELKKIQAQKKSLTTKRAFELAQELIDEVKLLGLNSFSYPPKQDDGKLGYKVKVTNKMFPK